MKRFAYRLEPVLRQREWALRDAQAVLADANDQVARQERQVAAVHERYSGALQDWTALVGTDRECGVDVFVRQAAYAADVAARLAADRAALAERIAERDAAAALLAACSREVDAAEGHRARAHARFRQQLAVKEFAEADDRWIDPSRKEER
jgi:hypothetical protein